MKILLMEPAKLPSPLGEKALSFSSATFNRATQRSMFLSCMRLYMFFAAVIVAVAHARVWPGGDWALVTPALAADLAPVTQSEERSEGLRIHETGYFPPPASTGDDIWRTVTQEQMANERRAFWYAIVAGGHWTAVCWQGFQERDTHRWVRHLKSLIDTVPYWKMDPHDELIDHGHCLALPNEHYVIYLGTGGTTTLQLGDRAAEEFVSEWIDPRSGKRRVAMPEVQGQKITFTAPSDDDWAIGIRCR